MSVSFLGLPPAMKPPGAQQPQLEHPLLRLFSRLLVDPNAPTIPTVEQNVTIYAFLVLALREPIQIKTV